MMHLIPSIILFIQSFIQSKLVFKVRLFESKDFLEFFFSHVLPISLMQGGEDRW